MRGRMCFSASLASGTMAAPSPSSLACVACSSVAINAPTFQTWIDMQIYEAPQTDTELYETDDLRIAGIHELSPPAHILREFAMTPAASKTVFEARQAIHNI